MLPADKDTDYSSLFTLHAIATSLWRNSSFIKFVSDCVGEWYIGIAQSKLIRCNLSSATGTASTSGKAAARPRTARPLRPWTKWIESCHDEQCAANIAITEIILTDSSRHSRKTTTTLLSEKLVKGVKISKNFARPKLDEARVAAIIGLGSCVSEWVKQRARFSLFCQHSRARCTAQEVHYRAKVSGVTFEHCRHGRRTRW